MSRHLISRVTATLGRSNFVSGILSSLMPAVMLLTVMTLPSCSGSDTDATSFRTIPRGLWAYGDTLNFVMPTSPDAASGTLEVALRHTNDYPYSNLWLEVTTAVSSGTVHTDTVNVELCDAFGRWYGNGFGDSFQMSASLPMSVVTDSVLSVGVRHIMRVDTLRGIDQVGVRLTQQHK